MNSHPLIALYARQGVELARKETARILLGLVVLVAVFGDPITAKPAFLYYPYALLVENLSTPTWPMALYASALIGLLSFGVLSLFRRVLNLLEDAPLLQQARSLPIASAPWRQARLIMLGALSSVFILPVLAIVLDPARSALERGTLLGIMVLHLGAMACWTAWPMQRQHALILPGAVFSFGVPFLLAPVFGLNTRVVILLAGFVVIAGLSRYVPYVIRITVQWPRLSLVSSIWWRDLRRGVLLRYALSGLLLAGYAAYLREFSNASNAHVLALMAANLGTGVLLALMPALFLRLADARVLWRSLPIPFSVLERRVFVLVTLNVILLQCAFLGLGVAMGPLPIKQMLLSLLVLPLCWLVSRERLVRLEYFAFLLLGLSLLTLWAQLALRAGYLR